MNNQVHTTYDTDKMNRAMSNKLITQHKESENNSISICDLLKNNTVKIIRKYETQTPIYVQLYSNYYDEYLHSLEEIFGTCYLSEKNFFDNLGIDEKTLIATDKFWNDFTETTISNIDVYTNFRKTQFDMMVTGMKALNDFVQMGMDYYAEMLSRINYKKNK